MSEKEKILKDLVEKSGKSQKEIEKLIIDKVNEFSGLVSEDGAIHIIANELGLKLNIEKKKLPEAEMKKIFDIKEAKTPVTLVCKVIKIYNKVTFSSKNSSEGGVQSILVGDETGIIRVVFWNDKTSLLENIKEGDILKIISGYTRENNNSERIEVHFGQYSDLEVNPKGVEIKLKEFNLGSGIEFKAKKISQLNEGDKNIKLNVVVTDFEIPRFYFACPECFKKIFSDEGVQKCAEHEEVKAIKIPIVNLVVDDGENSITIVGFRDRAEGLTGAKSEEIVSLTQDIDKYRTFSKKIIGSKMDIAGNVSVSQITGDKQFIVNQVLGVEFKEISEIVDELISEGVASKAKKESKEKSQNKKEEKFSKDKTPVMEEIDFEIEEINIDDDLL